MTELKTLKDLERKYWNDETGIPLIAVDIPTLKAEAIKWVRSSEKKYVDRIDEKKFMEFFNLTEEDINRAEERK